MLPSEQKLQEAIEFGCYGGGSEEKKVFILKNYLNSFLFFSFSPLNYYSAPAFIKTPVYCILKKIRRLNPSFGDIRFSHHRWVGILVDGVSTSLGSIPLLMLRGMVFFRFMWHKKNFIISSA